MTSAGTIGARSVDMTAGDRVSYELRMRPRFALLAAVGGVLLFAGAIIQSVGPQAKVSELTVQLLVTDRRAGLEVLGSVVNALGILALAGTLWFLFTAVKARKPEASEATWMVAAVGAVLAAVGGVGYGVVVASKAHQFATQGLQTYPEADHLLRTGPVAVLQYGGLIGSLLLAIGFVLVALNAMRVGLLTKMLGYVGIAAAAASLLLIGSSPALLIEVFWLLGTAYLLSGRWPSGDPPAWRSGEAVAWPSSAQLREERLKARGRDPRPAKRDTPAPEAATARTSARSPAAKRKRKRRR